MRVWRADVVGSLLRPTWLLAAQRDLAAGTMTPAAFKALEDRAVDEAVALQEAAGLEVVTDGEMRRECFQGQMTAAVDGFGEHGLDAFLWGEWRGGTGVGDRSMPRPASLGVVSKLTPRRHLSAEEFTYLRARTRRTPKVTLPSPALWANFWAPGRPGTPYPTLEHLLADVADILRAEVTELARLGATYIQLDAPQYPLLTDAAWRAFYEARGGSIDRWLGLGIELDNAVMADLPGVTFGMHL